MIEVPLQTVDNIMLDMHMGHALVGALALVILGTLPLKSLKILGLNLTIFGAIFLLTPVEMVNDQIIYRLAGVGLIVLGPLLYVKP